MKEWKSYHIFYHNLEKHDELIHQLSSLAREYVLKKEAEKWFFLRYWEGGPHIRFRLLGIGEEVDYKIITVINEFIKKNPALYEFNKEEYYKDHKFDGKEINSKDLIWHENGEIINFKYSPEYGRYGGHDVMNYSENIFMVTSNLADDINVSYNMFQKKLIIAAAINNQLYKLLIDNYGSGNLKSVLEYVVDFWKVFSDDYSTKQLEFLNNNNSVINISYERLLNSKRISEYISTIKEEMLKINSFINDKDYMDSIIISHIHMLNNRLGITPNFERSISKWILSNIN